MIAQRFDLSKGEESLAPLHSYGIPDRYAVGALEHAQLDAKKKYSLQINGPFYVKVLYIIYFLMFIEVLYS